MHPNERLDKAIAEMDLKQADFGERLGVAQSAVSRWRRGQTEITRVIALAIQLEFGISAEWLLTGRGDMRAKAKATGAVPSTKEMKALNVLRKNPSLLKGIADLDD